MAGAPIQLRQLARGRKPGPHRRFGPRGAVATAIKCRLCPALATVKMRERCTRVLACQTWRCELVIVELRAARVPCRLCSHALGVVWSRRPNHQGGSDDYLSAMWRPRKNHMRKMWRNGEGADNRSRDCFGRVSHVQHHQVPEM
jgi:hypothetical protein